MCVAHMPHCQERVGYLQHLMGRSVKPSSCCVSELARAAACVESTGALPASAFGFEEQVPQSVAS